MKRLTIEISKESVYAPPKSFDEENNSNKTLENLINICKEKDCEGNEFINLVSKKDSPTNKTNLPSLINKRWTVE